MEQKLPYYLAYPMPSLYDEDKNDVRDLEYMRSLYPYTAKMILPYVEEECDRLEYAGSMLYDEYPDQLQLRLMASRVYDKVRPLVTGDDQLIQEELTEQEMDMQQFGGYPGHRHPGRYERRRPHRDDRVRDIVDILLYQELLRRRCDHRRCNTRFF